MVLLLAAPAFAAPRVSEDDMFGGTAPAKTAPPKAAATPTTMGPDDRGLEPANPSTPVEESLQIGGTLSTEADVFIQEGIPLFDNTTSNPNILFLYLDSKLDNDARVFARGRLFYDPTGVSGGTPGNLSNPYGVGPGSSDNLKVSLQELRLSVNADRKIFFTFGRQKVKYGAAKFFNPTDFLNSQPLNFFLPSDERPGVDMVKMHLPSGTTNLYAMGLVGTAGTTNPSGGYFRWEYGHNGVEGFLGAGEISVSGYLPRNQAGRAGMDFSQSVGDFDVYFEGATGQDALGEWKAVFTTGASWQVRYADRSSNTLSFQAEYFTAGALAQFGVLSLFLPEPADLKDITFVETNLYSFLDQSGLSRLDTVYNFTPQVNGRLYVSGHWGQLGGVFHMPGQVAEVGTRLDVNF